MTTWIIQWHDDDGKDYRDIIHRDLITSNGTITHDIIGPRGGVSTAKAAITRNGNTVDIDYQGFSKNASKNLASGVMRLEFESDDLGGTPTVFWRGQGSTRFMALVATALPANQQFVPIYDEDGNEVHARFSVDTEGVGLTITMDSRGGTLGQPTERNRGYTHGLKLVLKRLASANATVTDAFLTSAPAMKESPDPTGRRLSPNGFEMPLLLSVVDTDRLAGALQRAQSTTLTRSKTGAGNTTRRFTLRLRTTLQRADVEALAARGIRTISTEDIDRAENDFDPTSAGNDKERVVRSIAARRGQYKFRKALLSAYSNRCAMTGCMDHEVLEGAHIAPYTNDKTNHVQNGLLLRADIHTLFDLDLIGVDISTWKIVVNERIQDPAYRKLHGSKLRLPIDRSKWPNGVALQYRHLAFLVK